MSDTSANTPSNGHDADHETLGEPAADRPPTTEEEAVAERLRRDVDVERVAEHYEEMNEIGKNVKGEGDLYQRD